MMILAVDVDYGESSAVVAGVMFEQWEDEEAQNVYITRVEEIAEYEPGRFYKRELPCILKLLKDHCINPDIIVVDGFVVLGEELKPGLGMHLYEALNQKVPIVGVAKKAFKGSVAESEIFRGKSEKPLYVNAVGIDDELAKRYILSMHGKHRIPTLLKLADRECRNN